MPPLRRWRPLILLVSVWLLFMYYFFRDDDSTSSTSRFPSGQHSTGHHEMQEDYARLGPAENGGELGARSWRKLAERYPVTSPRSLPQIPPGLKIPRIQAYPAPVESSEARQTRLQRQAAVKESFLHSWHGYKQNAWMADEVGPVTGRPKNTFGGWAATLVDALDTLWMMGLTEEFEAAVKAASDIDFTRPRQERINIFETTIRYLGGFLAAYEISGKKYPSLLEKAIEVGELVMCAFDVPSRMPIARWDWKYYMTGHAQAHHKGILVSELGSLTLEFTKLAQLTGEMKYYEAVQRISDHFEKAQDSTKLPGMWPVLVDLSQPSGPAFTADNSFTLGGMEDSLYEYFPKQYLMLGGALEQPRKMYEKFIPVAKKHLFKRVMNKDNIPLVISGDGKAKVYDVGFNVDFTPKGQHLTCFVGGMVGIASKIFNRPDELGLAQQLTEACVWAYNSTATGIMPEIFVFKSCGDIEESQTGPECAYDEKKWRTAIKDYYSGDYSMEPMGKEVDELIGHKKLVPGFIEFPDSRYILRPEAIESVFLMYRLTGDPGWMEKAWVMFEHVEANTRSEIGAASLKDVRVPGSNQMDSMESFWLAETLKYFYLVFSEFDLVDLDKWVLNTEAHPLHRPDVD